jgi:hypothetical protein
MTAYKGFVSKGSNMIIGDKEWQLQDFLGLIADN